MAITTNDRPDRRSPRVMSAGYFYLLLLGGSTLVAGLLALAAWYWASPGFAMAAAIAAFAGVAAQAAQIIAD